MSLFTIDMQNLYTQQENQATARKAALNIYLFFRKTRDKSESKEKTVEELVKRLHVTEDFAKQAVSQMWN